MNHLNPLPFQFEIEDLFNQMQILRERMNPDSELAEALDRCSAILEPHFNNVSWQEPVDLDCEFRKVMRGMKL